VAGLLVAQGLILLWVPAEATQGVIQRLFYVHVPAAWIAELAFATCALCGVIFLWLGDDRADAAAVAAAEGGLFFAAVLLVAGPLWARVAWGAYWTPEPRLTLTLLLVFIFIGYFMVRGAAASPDRAKSYSAVIAIVGALDLPLIHMSVYWFRSLHPQPVVLRPDGPTADPRMLVTLFVSLAAFTLVFAGLFWLRYSVELAERAWRRRGVRGEAIA
jgi:heme exporter protein C